MNSLFSKIRHNFETVSDWGIEFVPGEEEKLKIKIINRISIITIFFALIGLTTNLLLGEIPTVFMCVGYISVFLITVLANKKGYSYFAAHFCLIFVFSIAFIASILRKVGGSEAIFVLVPLISSVFLSSRKHLWKYSVLALFFYVTYIYFLNTPPKPTGLLINEFLAFVTALIVAYFCIFFYYRGMKNKEKEVAVLVEKLTKKNEELNRFTGIVSHDIKSPLKNLNMYAGLLLRRNEKSINAESKELIEEMKIIAKRGIDFTDNLLDYSRAERQIIEISEVNLDTVVKQSCQNLRTQLEESNTILNAINLGTINANQEWCVLVFQNIISNAIKYQPKENGKLVQQPVIDIKAENTDNFTQIIISDNGIGIAKEQIPNVFKTFKRVHSHQDYEGTGLGLATCKIAMEKMDGTITVESEIGKGSEFYLKFPNRL